MLAKPIKNLLCCLGIAALTFAACKKNDANTVPQFSEGGYSGRLISTSVQGGNTIQPVLPANINFAGGNYTANNIPQNQLAYTDFIPYTGTYQLLTGNTALVLTYVKSQLVPLPDPGFLTGQFTITYQADSLILTQNLSDGLSGYQFRLKKFDR
jgi:hypothetical protein